jgi:hypothetical protein
MNPKLISYVTCGAIVLIAIAYVMYLVAMWRQAQHDRTERDVKINELLDRVPKSAQTE